MMTRIVSRSVRAILIDDQARVLLIKRTRPGCRPYWTLPGGGVEPDDISVEAALQRELLEELGAAVDRMTRVFMVTSPTDGGLSVQYFYATRLRSLDPALSWSGPEFGDPRRGGYELQRVGLEADRVASIDLKPVELREFVAANVDALLDEVGLLAE